VSDQDTETNDTETETPSVIDQAKAAAEARVQEMVGGLREGLDGAKNLAQLIQDPDVRALLDAKQSGKKVKLVEDTGQVSEPVSFEGVDFDGLDNKGLVELVMRKVPGLISASMKPQFDELRGTTSRLDAFLAKTTQVSVTEQVDTAREKFKDFDSYARDMMSLSRDNPGLSVTELYHVAKSRKGEPSGTERASSEKPTGYGVRMAPKPRAKVGDVAKKSFTSVLHDALERLDIEGL
jgi:hypothetical protein